MQWSPPAAHDRRENGTADATRTGTDPARPGGSSTRGGAPAHRRRVPAPLERLLRHPRVRAVAEPLARVPRPLLAASAMGVLIAVLAIPSLLPSAAVEERGPVADVGSADFSFAANGVKAPTGRKPEAAKLWFADGSWWGALFVPARDAYVINRYDADAARWIDTGVLIDDRNASRADVLWTGEHLYVVSGGTDARSEKHAALFMRFSYDAGARAYAMDAGFPVRLTDAGAETFVLDRDDTGRVWVTFTRDRAVHVTHTLGTDRDWVAPYILPLQQARDLTDDDISAVVAYDGSVGIMWSDQTDGAMYFASRPVDAAEDDPWTVTAAIQGPALADDHMNLKRLRDDPAGLLVAVVKTSRNDAPDARSSDPLVVLLVLGRDGTWQQHVVGTVQDDATRPLLMVDEDHRELYVFTSAPCCSGGTIFYTRSRLDDIQFPEGPGTPFIQRGDPGAINNPTSTKQNVGRASGLLVIASDDRIDTYMHNFLRLDGPVVATPTSPAGQPIPVGTGQGVVPDSALEPQIWLVDGFEEAGLAPWTTVVGPGGRVDEGRHNARTDAGALHLVAGSDPEGRAAARVALPASASAVDVGLDFQVVAEGLDEGNVPLLRLFDESGERVLAVYRQNHRSGRIWVWAGNDHVPTSARIDLATWGHLDVSVRPGEAGATVGVRVNGRLAAEVPVDGPMSVATVQVGNDSTGQQFDLLVDNVRISR